MMMTGQIAAAVSEVDGQLADVRRPVPCCENFIIVKGEAAIGGKERVEKTRNCKAKQDGRRQLRSTEPVVARDQRGAMRSRLDTATSAGSVRGVKHDPTPLDSRFPLRETQTEGRGGAARQQRARTVRASQEIDAVLERSCIREPMM